MMRLRLSYRGALLAAALCLSAFLGARSVAQEAATSNFAKDVVEFDRTRDQVAANFVAKVDTLKQIAREVGPEEKGDGDKKELDQRIGVTLQGLFQETYALALQTHLLSLDNAVDKGGAAAEGPMLGMLATKFKVPIAEIVDRREKSGLGLGGVMLGYAIALAAKVPADEIFTNKQGNRSWMDVMADRQVTLQQLTAVFEDAK
jgi:hypothetical protein